MEVNIKDLTDSRDAVNKLLERFGVRFGVYRKGVFNEQLFPFDSVPRIISKQDWDYLERGLKQRVEALNLFLWDIYHEKKIMKDGIIPEEFVYSSKGYMPICEGINPAGKVYSHISGIDLVEGKDGRWYVLGVCRFRRIGADQREGAPRRHLLPCGQRGRPCQGRSDAGTHPRSL